MSKRNKKSKSIYKVKKISSELRWDGIHTDLPDWIANYCSLMMQLDLIRPRILPNLKSREIVAASDYSGEQEQSLFLTYATLIADKHSLLLWDKIRRVARQKHAGDGRRLSFKRLGDRQRKEMLPHFLSAADEINGALVVVAIGKQLPFLFVDKLKLGFMYLHAVQDYKPKKADMERALRIAFYNALFISGLCDPMHRVTWVTDEDCIVKTKDGVADMSRITGQFIQMFSGNPEGHFSTVTTSQDNEDLYLEDLAAIPDLAAGLYSYIATETYNRVGVPSIDVPGMVTGDNLPGKAENLYNWWFHSSSQLKKFSIVLYPPETDDTLYMVRTEVPVMKCAYYSKYQFPPSIRHPVEKRSKYRRQKGGVLWPHIDALPL